MIISAYNRDSNDITFDLELIEDASCSAMRDKLKQIVAEMVEKAMKRVVIIERVENNTCSMLLVRFFRTLCSTSYRSREEHDYPACCTIRLALEARICVRLFTTTFLEYVHTLQEVCLTRVQDRGSNETSDSDYGHFLKAIPA